MRPSERAATIPVGKSVFTYCKAGVGTPLVLLHGIGSAACAFDDQLAGLSNDLCAIAWDAPGYGGRTCPPDPAPPARLYVSGPRRRSSPPPPPPPPPAR